MTTIDEARDAHARGDWVRARRLLLDADGDLDDGLDGEALELLAMLQQLIGDDGQSIEAWSRAHGWHLDADDPARAAYCAFWAGMQLMSAGEFAQGGGWMAKARRLVEEGGLDCPASGYVHVPAGLSQLRHDPEAALADFTVARELGDRHREADLTALGTLGAGQALLNLGQTARGIDHLDEVMVAVVAGDVSPLPSGIIYCAVIDECQRAFDLARAREWTTALSTWCEQHPDLVPFRGRCLVHRSEIKMLDGDWPGAIEEAVHARENLENWSRPGLAGVAAYQHGEVLRRRGAFAEAEQAYRRASELGRSPDPGLSLLRLAQGDPATAAATSARTIGEATGARDRAAVLPAHVEVMLAVGDVPAARAAAEELVALADELDAVLLRATAGHALGAVELAEGAGTDAVGTLRAAVRNWQSLDTPYELARTRELLGAALEAVGDRDAAGLEREAARTTYDQLGAEPDLARLRSAVGAAGSGTAAADADHHGLSPRELEVLALVAQGQTNKAIAAQLVLSERTVERHVSNIFTKLAVSSRSAATAFAWEHGLV